MYLIVGLGNPGKKYAATRHNVGFRAICNLAGKNNIKAARIRFKSLMGQGNIAGEKVILAQPQTYMNNSGQAVRLLIDYFKIPLENIIIIYDDLDLSVGKIRIKKKGSAGGHNGLKSIINHLGSNEIPRIRVGIDRPPDYIDVIDYVLGHFSADEEKEINKAMDVVCEAVYLVLTEGYHQAMNKFN